MEFIAIHCIWHSGSSLNMIQCSLVDYFEWPSSKCCPLRGEQHPDWRQTLPAYTFSVLLPCSSVRFAPDSVHALLANMWTPSGVQVPSKSHQFIFYLSDHAAHFSLLLSVRRRTVVARPCCVCMCYYSSVCNAVVDAVRCSCLVASVLSLSITSDYS